MNCKESNNKTEATADQNLAQKNWKKELKPMGEKI